MKRPSYKWTCLEEHSVDNQKLIAQISYVDPRTLTVKPAKLQSGKPLRGWVEIRAKGRIHE